MRIGASEQVTVFLKNERRVEFRGSGNHELRCWPHRMLQRCARSNTSGRWPRATMCTEDIVSRDTSTAKTAVNRCHLHRLNTRNLCRHSITHSSRHQLLEMNREKLMS